MCTIEEYAIITFNLFEKNIITYLGYRVSERGVEPLEAKLDTIQQWPLPRSVKEIRGFM